MKPTQLLLTGLLLSVFASSLKAQEEKASKPNFNIGVHAAPTYCNRVLGMRSDFKPLMGFITGVSGQVNFSSRWALHVEMNCEVSRYIAMNRNSFPYGIPPERQETQTVYNYNNLEIPISMKFNFINKEKIKVFVNAGTINMLPISYKASTSYADGSTQQTAKTFRLDSRNHSLGLIAGLGTDMTLSPRLHLTLEARMTNGVFISYGLFAGLTYQLSK